MPLVHHYQRVIMRKARRPEWQDQRPRSKEGRDTYAIAARNQSMFTDAFLDAMQSLISSDDAKAFKAAWNRGDNLDKIMRTLPVLTPRTEDEAIEGKAWQRFIDRIAQAYGAIIQQAGEAEAKNLKRDLGVKMTFRIGEDEPMEKRDPQDEVADTVNEVVDEMGEGLRLVSGFIVPVNPHSIEWMRKESLRLVTENVTENQIETIRMTLSEAFEKGLRAETALGNVRANIGLLPAHLRAIEKRRVLLKQMGLSDERIERDVKRYREKLLRYRANMIARTETIGAQAHGRNTAWKLADDEGILPAVIREWTSAPESPNPTRPCKICLDLDGKQAKIGEPYKSKYLGDIMSPTAHPHCRCTEVLKRV